MGSSQKVNMAVPHIIVAFKHRDTPHDINMHTYTVNFEKQCSVDIEINLFLKHLHNGRLSVIPLRL